MIDNWLVLFDGMDFINMEDEEKYIGCLQKTNETLVNWNYLLSPGEVIKSEKKHFQLLPKPNDV